MYRMHDERSFLRDEREAAALLRAIRERTPLTLVIEADEEGAPRVIRRELPFTARALRRAASHRALAKAG